jgi:hypothetical protein
MPKGTGSLFLVGFFGLAVAADAQTHLSQTAGSQFDGTYAFVSSTKLTETFTLPSGQMLTCPDWTAGPLTIVRGQARFTTTLLVHFEGTVGSQGELGMSSVQPGPTRVVSGKIVDSRMVRARLYGVPCNYDYVWRK